MALPVMLWLLGWLQPWCSMPLVAGLIYCLYRHYVQLREREQDSMASLSPWMFLVYGMVSAVAVFLLGLDGRVLQGWDLIVRNPIYSELVDSEWPLVMPDGKVVMYALMFWLPPALVAKLEPGLMIAALQVWCFVGTLLMLLNLHGTLGICRSIMLVACISVFTPLAGMVDDVLNVIFHIDAIMGVHFRLPSAATQWSNTFHYFIAGGLYLTLTTERRLPTGMYVLVSALFACLHPILASVVFPLVVCRLIRISGGWLKVGRVFLLPEVYMGTVSVLIFLLYYSAGGSCWWDFTLNAPYAPVKYSWLVYSGGVLLALLPPLLVWWCTRERVLLLWAAWCPVIISLWYGETNGVNEWLYKFTVLYSFYIVYYLVRNIGQRKPRWVLGLLLACSAFSAMRSFEHSGIIRNMLNGFPVDVRNVRGEWDGKLYHPEHALYAKLTSDRSALPIIFR